jgi:hypothetical protein
MELDAENQQVRRLFYAPVTGVREGFEQCRVPEEIIDSALDHIEKAIFRALRHAGEDEDQEDVGPEDGTSEEEH